MMGLILIFPIVLGVLMLLIRHPLFSKFLLNIYALAHFIVSSYLVFFNDKAAQGSYFALEIGRAHV